MSPLLFNITKVVVVSAFSAMVSEMLGFKLFVQQPLRCCHDQRSHHTLASCRKVYKLFKA